MFWLLLGVGIGLTALAEATASHKMEQARKGLIKSIGDYIGFRSDAICNHVQMFDIAVLTECLANLKTRVVSHDLKKIKGTIPDEEHKRVLEEIQRRIDILTGYFFNFYSRDLTPDVLEEITEGIKAITQQTARH